MLRETKIYACSVQEVVALENGIRQRVLSKIEEGVYVVFYKWFPPEIVKHICRFNMPMAIVAHKSKNKNQYELEYRPVFRHHL